MGNQASSESLASTESISNQINNVSNENCITACDSEISNINMIIENSDIEGDVNVSAVCNILGSSCILKAALSTSVQNTQKNKQLGATMQSDSPLNWFSSQSSNIQESNNQSISNKVSNVMNSTCQNNSTSTVDGVNIELIGDKVGGNINVDSKGNITKSQCIIDNVARTTLANEQSNSQTAKVMQGSPILFAIIAIVIIVVVVMIGLVILGVGGIALKTAMLKKGNPTSPSFPSQPPPSYQSQTPPPSYRSPPPSYQSQPPLPSFPSRSPPKTSRSPPKSYKSKPVSRR